jgi:hypothetical protein
MLRNAQRPIIASAKLSTAGTVHRRYQWFLIWDSIGTAFAITTDTLVIAERSASQSRTLKAPEIIHNTEKETDCIGFNVFSLISSQTLSTWH